MPDRHLPDDLALWPTNPHELLGVSYDADARGARRAYLNLVRQYKPERAPEKFKRIREAYEFVERQIKARERLQRSEQDDDGDAWSLTGSPPHEEAAWGTAEAADANGESLAPATPYAPDAETECRDAWRDLCAGAEPADAFARLLAIHRRHAGSVEPCLRLYWLTVAAPEVDPQHDARHWLAEGLRIGRLEGRLRELYRRELEDHPHEALSDRCGALLRLDAPRGALADLAEWRWRALGKLNRCDLLLADLAHLRRRIVFDEEETWARLLLTAIDQLAWSDAPHAQAAAHACRQELDAMNHLHGALERDLDRLDLLWEAAAGWRRLRAAPTVPRPWTELVRLSWSRDDARIRPHLLPVLREIARDALGALSVMDEMARYSAAAVAQLGFTIETYRYRENRDEYDRRTEREIAALAERFLGLHDCSNYRAIRRDLLKFCLLEAIEPAVFAQAADDLTRHHMATGSWQDLIADDGPLRFVYAAYRAFWS